MNDLTSVLHRIYKEPLHLQADYAREHDLEVSTLASMGLISNLESHHNYGRKWRITGVALDLLREEGLL